MNASVTPIGAPRKEASARSRCQGVEPLAVQVVWPIPISTVCALAVATAGAWYSTFSKAAEASAARR